jgi:hypothetical protein
VHDPPAIEAAIAAFARRPNGGLIATASPFGSNHPGVIAALARARERDRGLFGWIVLSLVISPLLGGIFLFVLPRKEKTSEQTTTPSSVDDEDLTTVFVAAAITVVIVALFIGPIRD